MLPQGYGIWLKTLCALALTGCRLARRSMFCRVFVLDRTVANDLSAFGPFVLVKTSGMQECEAAGKTSWTRVDGNPSTLPWVLEF